MALLISFTDQSSSFVHGVELGRLLERMERGDDPILNNGFPVHKENVEVIRRTCKALGYIPSFGHCEVEGWCNFMGIKKTTSDN